MKFHNYAYALLLSRFPNASGALIYPSYGQGELSQAFCRRAAVKRCLYVSCSGQLLLCRGSFCSILDICFWFLSLSMVLLNGVSVASV